MTEEFGMEELLSQSEAVKPGAVVDGTIVGQMDGYLLVNVGLKQEASLSLKEFGDNVPKTGDTVSVLILRMSGPEGRPLVSWRQARERKNWDSVAAKFENKEPIDGKITKRIKGGVTVDIGLDAFMPASQMDEKQVGDPGTWVGRDVRALILEMDRATGNVLVSRRRLMEQEKAAKRSVTLETLEIGKVLKGRVTGLTNFGAFVDIGGVEGLLHVSDMSWTRVDKPESVFSVGSEVDVKVLKYDPATHRISLGRKQLLPHPWDGIEQKYSIGSLVKGKVTGFAPFGAFVEIEPGVEGLIHVSEFSWTDRVKQPQDVLKTGETVEAKLIGIDRAKEKISLSLKRAQGNPWEEAARLYPVGSQLEGEVTRLAPFGAFVKIPTGVEALLKAQDLSWTDRATTPDKILKPGEKIKAVVLEIDLKEEKMALGLKQLTPDPMKSLKIGQAVNGKVVKVAEFGIFVHLENGVDGLIRSSEIHNNRSRFDHGDLGSPAPSHEYKEGDPVTAAVLKINKKERKLELSIRRYERDQEKELLKKYSGRAGGPTLAETTGWGIED